MAHITLAITGSIASYKAADLVSSLKKQGHSVLVFMTRAATDFIQPLHCKFCPKIWFISMSCTNLFQIK